MEQEEHIVAHPNVMLGKPVIAGTRVTVQSVVERIAAGESVPDIVESHPALTDEKVRAALRYAARVLSLDEAYPREHSAPFS